MIIRKIILKDFRQFKGHQVIQVAASDGDGDRNVTVIHGENGRGKTGIYRAVVFGLFGEITLNQDNDIPEAEMRLVNTERVRETPEREAVEAIVEIEFDNAGRQYTIERKRVAARYQDKIVEDPGPSLLRILLPDGNTRLVEDEKTLQEEINSVLNPRVKEYYLFDGERMDRLTRAGATQRREVAKGIRSLLDIDALEHAKTAMERVTERFSADLGKASSVEYARVLSEIEATQKEIGRCKERLQEIDAELALADDEITAVDKELEAFQEIKEFVRRRNDLIKLRDQRARDLSTCNLSLSNVVSRCGMLLVRPLAGKVYNTIEAVRRNGELPAEIRRDLIERVLQRDECICGRPVLGDEDVLAAVRSWLDRTTEEAIEDSALRLWQHLAGIVSHLDDYEREIEGNLQSFGSASNDIAEYERQLDEIAAAIGSSERRDAGDLEAHRSNAMDKRLSLTADRKIIESKLQDFRAMLEQLQQKREEEAAKQSKKDEYTSRVEMSRRMTDALERISTRFTTEIRERLAVLASAALEEMLDAAGKTNICKVKVNDDYTLEVFNRFGDPWLAQISAGQRQVLSIAFVAALAEAASNGRLLEMPLFMDTPFGRLGGTHRENLMRLVPKKAAQWVLLATDTEFRPEEARMLEQTGRWGKLYFLEQDDQGNTVVEERPPTLAAFQAFAKDRGLR